MSRITYYYSTGEIENQVTGEPEFNVFVYTKFSDALDIAKKLMKKKVVFTFFPGRLTSKGITSDTWTFTMPVAYADSATRILEEHKWTTN